MSDRFGPNSAQVEALLARIATLTQDEVRALDAATVAVPITTWREAWFAGLDAAMVAARSAARGAARGTALNAAWAAAAAATDAAVAIAVRDLISEEHFNILTGPWVSVIGATWDETMDEEDEACGREGNEVGK